MAKNKKKIERIGEEFINNHGNKFVIIEYFNTTNITVLFPEYGYVKHDVTYQNCKLGNVGCPYDKTQGKQADGTRVGYLGLLSDGTNPPCYDAEGNPLIQYIKWTSMIDRVYNEKQLQNRPNYRDVDACEKWFEYAYFYEHFSEIANYELSSKPGYTLDKDFLQHGIKHKTYSPDTCMFVPKHINSKKQTHTKKEKTPKPKKKILLTHIETGMIMEFKKQQEVAEHLGITQSYVSRIMNGTRKFEGYKIETIYE
jgi:predicted XRE-type DNA-binding protein